MNKNINIVFNHNIYSRYQGFRETNEGSIYFWA
jgi:hypothetical protein